jgi:chondroitin-sulfate-ABC endolyase/exolyase
MMHFNKWSRGAAMLLGFFLISQTEAQVVKNERLLSFEDGEVPAYMTTDATARLTINDEHYKDGLHSLGWGCTQCKKRSDV